MLYMIFCKASCVNSIPPRFITPTDEQLLRSRRWIGARKKNVDSIIFVKQSHQLLPGQHLSVYRQQFAQHLL